MLDLKYELPFPQTHELKAWSPDEDVILGSVETSSLIALAGSRSLGYMLLELNVFFWLTIFSLLHASH